MTTPTPLAAMSASSAVVARTASLGLFASSAQVGHTVAHVPQPTHRSESTLTSSCEMEMAPVVQASAHLVHDALRLRMTAQRYGNAFNTSLAMPSNTPSILLVAI